MVWFFIFFYIFFLAFDFLSVLRAHMVFHPRHNGQWPPTFLSQMLSITFFSLLNYSERASISLLMLSAKQENYWYHFYYVFWSLSGDWIIKGVPSIFWGLTWRFLSASLFNISNKPFHKHHSGNLGNLHNNSWPTVITCKYKANIITSKIWKLQH